MFPCLYAAENSGQQQQTDLVQHIFENHSQDTRYKGPLDVSPALPAQLGTGGNNTPFGVERWVFRKGTRPHSKNEAQKWETAEVANTLNTFDQGEARANELVVEHVYCLHGNGIDRADTAGCNGRGVREDSETYILGDRYMVRRLTPLECERLQGFPDGWTDIGEWVDSKGKKHKEADSPRYKALGNSIAIPPWKWLLKRLCGCYERDATMASLFDGIGGFPYIWEQINGRGSCLWASEIEEFPMAVTKLRFGGDRV